MKWFNISLFIVALAITGELRGQNTLTVEDAIKTAIDGTAHGFIYLTVEAPEVIEKIQSAPDRSVELLSQRLAQIDLPTLSLKDETTHEILNQVEMIIELLGFLADPAGDETLSGLYIELQTLAHNTRKQTNVYERLSYLVLENLGNRYDATVSDFILNNINEMTDVKRHLSVNYVAHAGIGREDVINKLRKIINSNSLAAKDPNVRAAYKAVSQ